MRLNGFRGAAALCLLAACPGPAHAVAHQSRARHVPVVLGLKAADELAAVWRDVCLDAFPAEDAVTALAAQRGFRVMTEVEASAYLHDAAGRGWFFRTPLADYAVLIEAGGAPTCSVRRMTPNGLPAATAYFAARDTWVKTRAGSTLRALDPQQDRASSGAESEGIGSALVDPAGRTSDLFLAIVTEYHGAYHGHDAAAARGGPGVEIRLVHTIGHDS